MEVIFKKSLFNDDYIPYLEDFSHRFLIWYGGRGSGKSHSAGQRIIYNTLKYSGFNTLVIRKWLNSNRYSTYSLIRGLIDEYDLNKLFEINKTDMSITCKSNKNQILFKGLDDREKIKGIKPVNGKNVKHGWIEEANQISQADMIYLNNSLRGKDNTGIPYNFLLTFNPVSQMSWLKSFFFDTQDNDFRKKIEIFKTTYKNNKFLDDEYIETLEALKYIDEIQYKVDVLGEWGSFGNIIFDSNNWEVKEFSRTDLNQYRYVSYGLDWGSTHPAVVVFLGIDNEENIYVIDELCKHKLTNPQLFEKMNDFIIDKNIPIICDSAEPKSIREGFDAGFYTMIGARKGPNSVTAGIKYIRGRKRIYINACCQNTIKEFSSWAWETMRDGTLTESPQKWGDDSIKAIMYGTENWRR